MFPGSWYQWNASFYINFLETLAVVFAFTGKLPVLLFTVDTIVCFLRMLQGIRSWFWMLQTVSISQLDWCRSSCFV